MACRVDRLRLLGNGVVPDQVALAYPVLWERLMSEPAPAPRLPETPPDYCEVEVEPWEGAGVHVPCHQPMPCPAHPPADPAEKEPRDG